MTGVIRRPFETDLAPYELFERLRGRGRQAVLLESRPGPKRLARFSMLAADPAETLVDADGADPLPTIREIIQQHAVDAAQDEGFVGGLMGAISYDAVGHFDHPDHPVRAPTYLLGLYLDAVVYDHRQGRAEYVTAGETREGLYQEARDADAPDRGPLRVGEIRSNTTRERFGEMIADTKRRIRDGETYQTVVSRRFDAPYEGDLGDLYRRLQAENPSPYMYFLDFDDAAVVGSSPEMLLRVEGDQTETFPIAGTRPVAQDAATDEARKKELLEDPKERAEHIMLVDLARNDLARVGRFGTIEVPTYMKVESYANVHHIVSRVTGRLREDADALDAFRAVFPAGTVTGAPKIRAMQIIDGLEAEPRGLYAGAVGYFGLNGALDSAITIRTLTADGDGNLSVQAGAGIVQDSVAENEWLETQHKANAILHFLEATA